MRKNRMMRAASALLVAVLLTTSTISGTFAKYVTTSEAKDQARVAKWGVELQVVGNLYGETYKDTIVADTAAAGEFSVQSIDIVNSVADPDDVVAPGTENYGDGLLFSLKGQPEVDGKITSNMTVQNIFLAAGNYGVMLPIKDGVVTADNYDEFFEDGKKLYYKDGTNYAEAIKDTWVDGREYFTLEDELDLTFTYYPVVYSLLDGSTTFTTGNHSSDSLIAIAELIAGNLGMIQTGYSEGKATYENTLGKTFEANTNLVDAIKLANERLVWSWAFEQTTSTEDCNKADTILGMLKNTTDGEVVVLVGGVYVEPTEYTHYCLNTMFELKITVEQVD